VDSSVFPNVNEHIPLNLYEKIIRELAEVEYSGMSLYSAFGEPLLYKNIEDVLKTSKQYCPNVRNKTVTDGDFVTPAKLQPLFEAGLDTLLISLYDGSEQMGIFQAIIDDVGLRDTQVILRKICLPPEEHDKITLSNRAGMVNMPEVEIGTLTEPLRHSCFYPFYQVFMNYDGAVLFYPHDWIKKIIVGNLNNSTVHQLLNSGVIHRVRRNLASDDQNFAPYDSCDVDGTLMGRPHFEQWIKYYKSQGTPS